MKLNILSDLHLGFGAMDWPVNDADVVVLAGDISRPREAVAWALRFDKPVLYVPGNHEFYGSSIDGALEEFQHLCTGTQVQMLDQRERVLGGVRFLGATLWTDFELFDEPPVVLVVPLARLHAGEPGLDAGQAVTRLGAPRVEEVRELEHLLGVTVKLGHDSPRRVKGQAAPGRKNASRLATS